jgi:hypothetical protein
MFAILKKISIGKIKALGFGHSPFYSSLLSNVQRDSFSVSSEFHDIIIGLSLGNLYIRREYKNARLMFEQGLIHESYILHLYDLFKDYCNSSPAYSDRKPDSCTGKIYFRITFNTYSLPCFNYYYDLFYKDRVKTIPLNIGELLTARSLAYWAMDDGNKKGNGFHLNTHSYTLSEVELLIKVLKQNFNLNCSIQKSVKNQLIIYKLIQWIIFDLLLLLIFILQ